MNVKKVTVVIVEGVSDEVSLGGIITKLFKNKFVRFQIIRGDILTDKNTNNKNILIKINEQLKKCMNENYFNITDIEKVIHIVDTDGVYVNPKNIEFSDISNTHYENEIIKTNNVSAIVLRNDKKSNLLNRLMVTENIRKNIPYEIYYFSCNLEHVLHNVRNVDNEEKKKVIKLF